MNQNRYNLKIFIYELSFSILMIHFKKGIKSEINASELKMLQNAGKE